MGLFADAVNRPADAFKRRSGKLSWILVITAVLIVAVFDQMINFYVNAGNFDVAIDVFKMIWISGAGIATYLAAGLLLWAVCKAFGSKTNLRVYLGTWGITYIPTIICALAVSFAETYFYVFWNNSIWGMLLSIAFVAILIWKIVLYVIFLREVADLKGKKLAGAFILCGIALLALAAADMRIGLKTPIL